MLILNTGLDRFSSQKITYGGKASDRFTTFEIGKATLSRCDISTFWRDLDSFCLDFEFPLSAGGDRD